MSILSEETIAKMKAMIAEAEAEAEKAGAAIKAEIPVIQAKIKNAQPWERYALLGGLLFVLVYLLWSVFHKPVSTAQVFTSTKPAISAPKVPGPIVTVPIKKVDKAKVKKKFPEYHEADADEDEVVDTSDVGPSPNGVTVITKIDTKTGEVSSSTEPKKAPWFAFENNNTLGAGVIASTDGGEFVPVYYKRDIVRVKNVHVLVETGVKVPLSGGKFEAHGGAFAEYRF